ncbi:MAG TPA: S8 family peptidase [Candidatus Nitrosotenuis sp.]|nr:S8 family peptidase [Candidatus Nitrosotenuis sp.]
MAALRSALARLPGNSVTADLPLVDGFAARVDEAGLELLRREGARVVPDEPIHLAPEPDSDAPHPLLDVSAATLGLPELWQRGLTGKGVAIAVLDTGIAPHPDYNERIVAFYDTVNGREKPYDDRGHGTHVAGICAGSGRASKGRYKGAAPEANLVGIKVFDHLGNTDVSHVVRGIQWAVENKDRLGIKVLNISFGAPAKYPVKDDPVAQAVEAAVRAGLFVVCASGNSGPWPRTIDTPGTAPSALTVGATVTYGTPELEDDKVAYFSGSGPTYPDGYVKPDVVAPGKGVVSTSPDGGYVTMSGTSMAAPLVAGTAALMYQLRPDLSPGEMKQLLRATAQRIRSYNENIQGQGVVQADRAASRLDPQYPGHPPEGGRP